MPRLVAFLLVGAQLGVPPSQSDPGPILFPTLVSVTPDVIAGGSPAPPIRLKVQGRPSPTGARVQACNGDTLSVSLQAPLSVKIPGPFLTRPCILRLSLAGDPRSLPLAVADPVVFTLSVPPIDPDAPPRWTGLFSTLCEADTTQTTPFESLVALMADSLLPPAFVLGKGAHAVLRLPLQAPLVHPAQGVCGYLVLPGVQEADVRWEDEDVEGFWIAVLGADGHTLADRQFLSTMVTEPSGPLDR